MIETIAQSLVQHIRPLGRCVVAFSGGVDSSVIAMAAYQALPEKSVAVTALSPSVSSFELDNAKAVAHQIGIRHQIIETREIDNPDYVANDGSRCFYCKSELYAKIQAITDQADANQIILNGTNLDDLGDHRPGLNAARDFKVQSPFVDLKIGKTQVRQLAQFWRMDVADKPAAPCLASRVAYGQKVTRERLWMVEQSEAYVRSLGFRELRVRFHENDHARIEVPLIEVDRLSEFRDAVTQKLKELGFLTVEIDPRGLRSGNLNDALPIYQA